MDKNLTAHHDRAHTCHMTTNEHTAYIGRTTQGERIYVHISITSQGPATTTGHEEVANSTRISIMGSLVEKGRRSVSLCGQIINMLEFLVNEPESEYAPGWTRDDAASLLAIWRNWHMNDMRADCDHMTLPDDESYDARRRITCPVTGYRYGSAWLHHEPPTDVVNELRRLTTLPNRLVPHYV